jgi:hypothetical protein
VRALTKDDLEPTANVGAYPNQATFDAVLRGALPNAADDANSYVDMSDSYVPPTVSTILGAARAFMAELDVPVGEVHHVLSIQGWLQAGDVRHAIQEV